MNRARLSKEKKQQLAGICLGTTFLLTLLTFFLIGSRRERVEELNRSIASMREKVARAERLVRMSGRVRKNLQENRQWLAREEALLPAADQYKWIAETVLPYMRAREVIFEECTPNPNIQNVGLLPRFAGYKTARFSIKASATFQAFGKFLADFENEHPYVAVENLKIHPQGTRAGKLALERAREPEPAERPTNLEFDLQLVCLMRD